MAPPPVMENSLVPVFSGLQINGSNQKSVVINGDMNVCGIVTVDEELNVSNVVNSCEISVYGGLVNGALNVSGTLNSSTTNLEECSASHIVVFNGSFETINVSDTLVSVDLNSTNSSIINSSVTYLTATTVNTTDIVSSGVGNFTDVSVTSGLTVIDATITNATVSSDISVTGSTELSGTLLLNGLSSDVPAQTFQVYIANGTVNGVSGSLLAIVGE